MNMKIVSVSKSTGHSASQPMFVKGVQLTESPAAKDPAEKPHGTSLGAPRPAFRVVNLTPRLASEKTVVQRPQEVLLRKQPSVESDPLSGCRPQTRTPRQESALGLARGASERRPAYSPASLSGTRSSRQPQEPAPRLSNPSAQPALWTPKRRADGKSFSLRHTEASPVASDGTRRAAEPQQLAPALSATRLRLSEILKDNVEIQGLDAGQLPIQLNSLLIRERRPDPETSTPLRRGTRNWRKVRLVHKSAHVFSQLFAAARLKVPAEAEPRASPVFEG